MTTPCYNPCHRLFNIALTNIITRYNKITSTNRAVNYAIMSNKSDPTSSISALLALSDSQYRIYDIGRRVTKITKSDFEKIEAGQLPYPYPSQSHAFIAVAFWQKQSSSPYLWFVKLPLDERGLLNQGARNHFIAIIIEALGSDLSVDPTEQQEGLLKKNPYHFTPAQYKLAAINSIVSMTLHQAASRYYAPAQQYLSGRNGWDAWHDIGVQGLSDIAFRINEETNEKLLVGALAHIPEPVLIPLLSALENIALPASIIQIIIDKYESLKEEKLSLKTAIIRALGSSTDHPYSQAFICTLLSQKTLTEEVLIIIAGRLWSVLEDSHQLMSYLEQLAQHNNELFFAIFKDLVAIPTIRPTLLQAIRSPERSETLALAIGEVFKQ